MRLAGRIVGIVAISLGLYAIIASMVEGCPADGAGLLSEYWGLWLVAGLVIALGLVTFLDTFDSKRGQKGE